MYYALQYKGLEVAMQEFYVMAYCTLIANKISILLQGWSQLPKLGVRGRNCKVMIVVCVKKTLHFCGKLARQFQPVSQANQVYTILP